MEQGNYPVARSDLDRLSHHPTHARMAQQLTFYLLYHTGQFAPCMAYAMAHPRLLQNKETKLRMAEAAFFLQAYDKAMDYYQAAIGMKPSTPIDRSIRAKWAHACYQTKAFQDALHHFEALKERQDAMAQMAHYYAGLIHRHKGQQEAAIAAWSQAPASTASQAIQEAACMEIGHLYQKQGAWDKLASQMKSFTTHHPNHSHLLKAQTLLAQGFYRQAAYQKAAHYLTSLPYKNETLLALQQKACFYQGLITYNQEAIQEAMQAFKQP